MPRERLAGHNHRRGSVAPARRGRLSHSEISAQKNHFHLPGGRPGQIRHARPRLSAELTERLADARMRLVRFDEHQDSLPFNLPSLLLRSESAASSQIENLTSSARNIALAELSSSAPPNALVIAGNIDAMRCALNLEDALTTDGIRQIHRQLLKKTALDFAGELRGEQVWVWRYPLQSPRCTVCATCARPRR